MERVGEQAELEDRRDARLRRAVLCLIVTQLIGWGTVFHVPAVLYGRIAAGTGTSREFIFAGLTLMLLISASLSARVGRQLERDGARRWGVIGSCLVATGLLVLSVSRGPFTFLLAWVIFGAAMPIALNQVSSTALVQIAPARARGAIAVMLMITGVSSTVAWPTLIWLDGLLGWRSAVVVCAAANLLVCVPLHAWSLPGRREARHGVDLGPKPEHGPLPEPVLARGVYPLAAVSLALGGMLTWGIPLHMVGILTDYGHDEARAVFIGGLLGPGQFLARGFEMVGGRRFDILLIGVVAAALMPAALMALLLGGGTAVGALTFAVGYGVSAGFNSIVRAVAPLRLFGAAAYARVLGRLSVPQNIAFAATPFGFAIIRENLGAPALVELSLALALLCLVASALLAWRVRSAEQQS